MQKLLSTAVLLLLSVNTANIYADVISGKIIESTNYTQHKLLKDGKTYHLKINQPTDLKPQQNVEIKGKMIDEKTIVVDEVIVIS